MSEKKIEFVQYTGKAPSLCFGELTIMIDDKAYTYGPTRASGMFWHSGGGINAEKGTAERDMWCIKEEDLPEELKGCAAQLEQLFNTHVAQGCCGGCLGK